jgi:signal transduction histidine kinase
MTGIGWRMEDLSRNLSRSEYRARQNLQHLIRLSRDMCDPLELISRHCDRLSTTDLSDEQQEWLAMIRDNTRILYKHIQRNIDLSVIDENDTSTEGPVAMKDMFDEVVELYSGLARDRNISIETHLGNDMVRPVLGDRQRLRQILVNLLDSAIRNSKAGFVRIGASMIPDSERPLCLKARIENPCESTTDDVNGLPKMSLGLSHKIIRGLCGIMGGRFEIGRDSDGTRVLRVYLRAEREPRTGGDSK